MIKTPYETGGFAFAEEEMMEKALKESEGIRYIRNSADMEDPQMVFGIYCQMVQQRIFETPVGYSYLHELQTYLRENPFISNRDIPPIPVVFRREKPNETASQKEQQKKPMRTKEKNVNYKPWFKASLTVSIILLLIVIGMFAVTATSGNINIVNYENALIEKYENWETQLKEREERLKEREKALTEEEQQKSTEEIIP